MKNSNLLHLQNRQVIQGISGKPLSDPTDCDKSADRPHQPDTLFEIANRGSGWLSTAEAAKYLSISPGQLRNLTSNGKVVYYKLGRSNRYLAGDLDQLLFNERRGPYGN